MKYIQLTFLDIPEILIIIFDMFVIDRDEVSACIESSYNQISQKEACRMLFFDKQADLLKYAAKVFYYVKLLFDNSSYTRKAHIRNFIATT